MARSRAHTHPPTTATEEERSSFFFQDVVGGWVLFFFLKSRHQAQPKRGKATQPPQPAPKQPGPSSQARSIPPATRSGAWDAKCNFVHFGTILGVRVLGGSSGDPPLFLAFWKVGASTSLHPRDPGDPIGKFGVASTLVREVHPGPHGHRPKRPIAIA